MALSREDAKGGILTRDTGDPELEDVLSSATDFRLDLVRENNRHTESMRGLFSKVFGHDSNTPVHVAACGMLLGLIGCCGLWAVAGNKPPAEAGVWMQQAERLLAFVATCVAFIFGKGIKEQ